MLNYVFLFFFFSFYFLKSAGGFVLVSLSPLCPSPPQSWPCMKMSSSAQRPGAQEEVTSTATVAPTGGTGRRDGHYRKQKNTKKKQKNPHLVHNIRLTCLFSLPSLSGCPIAAAVKVSKPQDESLKCRQTPDRSPRYPPARRAQKKKKNTPTKNIKPA